MHWNINVDASCIFCKEPVETIAHLFFECPYWKQIWDSMARRVLKDKCKEIWTEIMRFIVDSNQNKLSSFSQSNIYSRRQCIVFGGREIEEVTA